VGIVVSRRNARHDQFEKFFDSQPRRRHNGNDCANPDHISRKDLSRTPIVVEIKGVPLMMRRTVLSRRDSRRPIDFGQGTTKPRLVVHSVHDHARSTLHACSWAQG
jgi:hypothetical protein